MPQPKEKPAHIGLVKAEKPDLKRLIREDGGYFRAYNDLTDVLIKELGLNAYEQALLFRLVRLSHGWNRVTCTVGNASLREYTNLSKNTLRRAVDSLTALGVIEIQGTTSAGTTYRVLPGVTVPTQGTPRQGTPVPPRGTAKPKSVPARGTIKDKETETNKESAYSEEDLETFRAAGGKFQGEAD